MGCTNSTQRNANNNSSNNGTAEKKLPIQFSGIDLKGKSFPKATDKILIVGAGPSGLHMGHLLQKKGYKNIKFYEATDRIAGKSLSIPHRVQNDVVHELGTCYMHPAYDKVRDLLKELEEAAKNGVSEEVEPKRYRVYAKTQEHLEHYFDKKDYIEFEPWIYATVEKEILPKEFWFLPDKFSCLSVVIAIERYAGIYKEILGEFDYNLLPPLHKIAPEKYAKIQMPFQKFLESHDLVALIPLLGYGMTAQGYGILQTIPTYYAMIWITPRLLKEYINPLAKHPKKVMLRKGFQNLWETMAKVDNFDITFNSNIESIVRSSSGVKVKGTQGLSEKKPLPQEDFDYVIISCPPKEGILNLDWSDEEKGIFSKLNSCIFKTTLFERDPDPELKEHLSIWPEFLIGEESGKGNVYASRDSAIALKLDNRTDQNEVREQMCYQFWDDRNTYDEAKAKEEVEQFARNQNIPGFKILHDHKFDYFYHFEQKELNEGYPYKVLDLQGKNRTLFVHAGAHFESVLDIVNYNKMLFENLFPNK